MKPVRDLASWSAAMKNKYLGPQILAYAKKTANEDMLKFLTSMRDGRKTLNEYTLYIKRGARYEMNIDADLRAKFDTVAAQPKPDWSKAPWNEAIRDVLELFNRNISPKIVAPPENSDLTTLPAWVAAMKDKEWGPKLIAQAKKGHSEEILKFLSMMSSGKKDKNTYEIFIKSGGKQEINIDSDLRGRFDAVAAQPSPNWGSAPWDEATREMLKLFRDNVGKHVLPA